MEHRQTARAGGMDRLPKVPVMRVFIAGGSGLIGRRLAKYILESGHHPIILSRHADAVRRDRAMWPYQVIPGDPTAPGPWQEQVDGCDAVVNLAGHGIFADRWNAEIKHKIRDSRVYSAEHLTSAIKNARSRPKVYVQGSAIGYYGPQGDEELAESSPSGTDFLAVVCRECEDVSRSIETLGVRRAIVRTGIVLAPDGGALRLMTPIFKLGPGTPVGSGGKLVARGDQWMSWIHVDDIVGILALAIDNEGATGPLNGTAPNPVRNAEFAKTFSSVLKKPYTPWRVYLPVGPPDGMLRLVLGEVATIITTGQKVIPAKPLALGYSFKFPLLADALRAVTAPAPVPLRPAPHPRPAGAHH
jgi:uncharacterized protein (TIGR01777 family)